MKVAELTGKKLDYWVAKALGAPYGAAYSSEWYHGGPIIDRGGIGFWRDGDEWIADFGCPVDAIEVRQPHGRGPTPLVAAMRAFLRQAFGEEVPDSADHVRVTVD